MSYLRPLLSVTLVNRKALRSFSAMPPRNCQRTSGCISVSLLIGPRDRDQEPCRVERAHMIVQIGILACGLCALCRFRVGLGKGDHGAFRLDRVESFVRAFQ